MSKFNIYSSSAGSGKTFTLTKEYIKLALQSDKDYYIKRILAITFTNDAAQEMKSRILDALKEFADLSGFNENSKFWGMFQSIVEETNLPPDMLQFRAADVFKYIIKEYSDFSVKTIDSFVNQLVSAFTEDLGLPFNYEIVLDKDSVLLEAVERLIEKAGNDEYKGISEVLEDYIRTKADEGKSWNAIPTELANFSQNILNDQYYGLISKLNGFEPQDFQQIRSQIYAFIKLFEKEITDRANYARKVIEDANLTIDDFTRKKAGIGAYFENLALEFEKKVVEEPNSYHRAAIEEDVWYTKTTPLPIMAMIDGIKEPLMAIFNEIQEIRKEKLPRFLLYKSILPHFHKLALLSKIKAEFDAVLDEKNQVFISEFNRKILNIVLNEPVPFIYERIGEKYNHILVDEFQDTSEMQFFNLSPLIANSLSKNHFNLLVGDGKQSIYRWRGGKVDMIVHLFHKNVEPLAQNLSVYSSRIDDLITIQRNLNPVSLNTNWRSCKEIIDFNNEFFEQITNLYSSTYPFISDVYGSDFKQQLPPKPRLGGQVSVEFTQKDGETDPMLGRILLILQNVIADGYSLKDIAILCRSNKNSSSVANFLKEQGFDIISSDSLLLKNSGSIRLLISFLKVLNQVDNKLVKYEAAYLFYQQILHQIPDNEANKEISETIDCEDLNAFYDWLATKGYSFNPWGLQRAGLYEITEKIIQTFGLFERSKDKEYLFRFLDIVLNFGLKESNHLQDFLKYWEDKKDKISVVSSDEADAITITTIHKSKGLEYPIVIIPYANWAVEPFHNSTIWANYEGIDYQEFRIRKEDKTIKLEASPIPVNKTLENTDVKEQVAAERQSTFLENLNMLYVAFTRPTDKLFVISEKKWSARSKKFEFGGVAKLMKDYLDSLGLYNDEESIFEVKNSKTIRKENKNKVYESVVRLNKIISEDRSDRLRLRRTSEKIFDPETLDKSKDRGNKVHAAFAKIRTKNDIQNAIRDLEFEGIINQNEGESIQQEIEKVINLPELSPLFEENLIIENEREILLPNGEIQRPDRVVIKDNAVYIIDYKTGAPKESHKTQLGRYGTLYRQMGYQHVNLMLVYLENNEVISL
ncbi:MAG: UvrD-helicase domain-containing protein [Spirosomaceae bacterium]|jgi:ATP-dependent exoDNAse (exonuclease V) beta subunit|nr:UvrD-helicase domain-containing protein [Spirosomataceae bacterium]